MHLLGGTWSLGVLQLLYAIAAAHMFMKRLVWLARSGGSMGTAFVWFHHPEAAQDAFQKYNNIALDGKPMRIEFDQSEKILTSGVRYVRL